MFNLLSLDIETSPPLVFCWNLHDPGRISLEQVVDYGGPICMAYQWIQVDRQGLTPKRMQFTADWKSGGKDHFIATVHKLLSQADGLVTYNGARFDWPKLHGTTVEAGYSSLPDPVHVDLFKPARKLGYPSSKLDHVAVRLLGPEWGKMSTGGFKLWRDVVLHRDPEARAKMEAYNRRDVEVTTAVFRRMWELGLKTGMPNLALSEGVPSTLEAPACPGCASTVDMTRQGFRTTEAGVYQRWQCGRCGRWSKGGRAITRAQVR